MLTTSAGVKGSCVTRSRCGKHGFLIFLNQNCYFLAHFAFGKRDICDIWPEFKTFKKHFKQNVKKRQCGRYVKDIFLYL